MEDPAVFAREAAAVGMKAQEQGVARLSASYDDLLSKAAETIQQALRRRLVARESLLRLTASGGGRIKRLVDEVLREESQ